MAQHKFLLDESRLPKAWYNIAPDMPVPPQPVLHPQTREPVTPDFLSVLFPMSIIQQEVSQDRWIEIPEPVREVYRLWRPTPLHRAVRLERALDTPAHIYYKYEGVSPVGSHKPNTAVAQAFFNKEVGTKALTTETGAGQWGTALAMACNFFARPRVYMSRSRTPKPYRQSSWSFAPRVRQPPIADVRQEAARGEPARPLAGIAISEAVNGATSNGPRSIRWLGSAMCSPSVGDRLEALEQMEMAGEYPDVVIGCAGAARTSPDRYPSCTRISPARPRRASRRRPPLARA